MNVSSATSRPAGWPSALLLACLMVLMVRSAPAQERGEVRGIPADTLRMLHALTDTAAAYVDGEPAKALRLGQALYERSRRLGYVRGQAEALFVLASAHNERDELELARRDWSHADSLFQRVNDPARRARTLNRLASMQKELAQHDASERSYLQSIALYEAAGDPEGRARSSYDLGLLYWHLGRFEAAVLRYRAALTVFEQLGDRLRVARCLNNIGLIFYHWAGYKQALDYYQQSLALRRELGDDHGAALVLTNIGKTYQEWGKMDRALQVYEEAHAHAHKLGPNRALAYTLYSIASVHATLGHQQQANAYFDQAESVYREVNYLGGYVETLIGRARLYAAGDSLGRAFGLLHRALDQARADSLVILEATALQELGRLYQQAGDHVQARDRLEESLAASERLGKRGMVKDNHRLLAASHEALGAYPRALYHYQHYAAAADSIYGERSERLLAEVDARYEAERRAQENVHLRREQAQQHLVLVLFSLTLCGAVLTALWLFHANRQKREANRRLAESNALIQRERDEQKRLLQILCHDLANPFASIQGCLDVILEEPAHSHEFGAMAQKVAQQGLDTISLVREMQVLDRDHLDLTPVSLARAVDDAVLVLRGRFEEKGIALDLDIDPALAVWAEHRSLTSSVVANVLTNALKFSPGGSTVHLRADTSDGAVRLVVRDHGIGMPDDVRARLFDLRQSRSRPGTQGEGGSGFGLPLVKRFVTLYGGTIEVHSRERHEDPVNHGTAVHLVFRPARLPEAAPLVRAAELPSAA